MKRVVILIALIAAFGAVSVPAATADGVNLCVGCTSPQPTASGSVGICADAVPCPVYFWYSGYYWYGPQVWYMTDVYKNPYQVWTFYKYSSGWHRLDCYYLMSSTSMFTGCWWKS